MRSKNESEGKIGRERTQSDAFIITSSYTGRKTKQKKQQGVVDNKTKNLTGTTHVSSLDNNYDGETVQIFPQGNGVIRVCP